MSDDICHGREVPEHFDNIEDTQPTVKIEDHIKE